MQHHAFKKPFRRIGIVPPISAIPLSIALLAPVNGLVNTVNQQATSPAELLCGDNTFATIAAEKGVKQ